MKSNKKVLIYLIIIAIFDAIIPIPVMALILIYVVVEKPEWFKKIVAEVYTT
jgi:hypothetical protein